MLQEHSDLDLQAIELNDVGFDLLDDNQVDKAISYFEEAMSCNPDYVDPYCNLISIYLKKQDSESLKKAISYGTVLITLKHDNSSDQANAYCFLATAHYMNQDKNNAINNFVKAIMIDPPSKNIALLLMKNDKNSCLMLEKSLKAYQSKTWLTHFKNPSKKTSKTSFTSPIKSQHAEIINEISTDPAPFHI